MSKNSSNSISSVLTSKLNDQVKLGMVKVLRGDGNFLEPIQGPKGPLLPFEVSFSLYEDKKKEDREKFTGIPNSVVELNKAVIKGTYPALASSGDEKTMARFKQAIKDTGNETLMLALIEQIEKDPKIPDNQKAQNISQCLEGFKVQAGFGARIQRKSEEVAAKLAESEKVEPSERRSNNGPLSFGRSAGGQKAQTSPAEKSQQTIKGIFEAIDKSKSENPNKTIAGHVDAVVEKHIKTALTNHVSFFSDNRDALLNSILDKNTKPDHAHYVMHILAKDINISGKNAEKPLLNAVLTNENLSLQQKSDMTSALIAKGASVSMSVDGKDPYQHALKLYEANEKRPMGDKDKKLATDLAKLVISKTLEKGDDATKMKLLAECSINKKLDKLLPQEMGGAKPKLTGQQVYNPGHLPTTHQKGQENDNNMGRGT